MNRGASTSVLKHARHFSLATLAFCLLAACGGDDSGGGSNPTPAPTAAPSPTPSPAPTPTPSPSASYSSVVDFTKDLFAESPVAEITYVSVYDEKATLPDPYYVFKTTSSRLLEGPSAGTFTWDAAKKEATARIGSYFQTFSGKVEDRPPSWSTFESYYHGPDQDYSFRWLGLRQDWMARIDLETTLPCTYPPGQPATCTKVIRYANIGRQTLSSELRLTGSESVTSVAMFSLFRREKPSEVANSATIPLSIDYGSRTLMTQWNVEGQTFILQGQYRPDLNTRLAGTIRSVDGQYTGQFVGDFYGPGAKNLAIVFSAQGTDRAIAGRLVAGW